MINESHFNICIININLVKYRQSFAFTAYHKRTDKSQDSTTVNTYNKYITTIYK